MIRRGWIAAALVGGALAAGGAEAKPKPKEADEVKPTAADPASLTRQQTQQHEAAFEAYSSEMASGQKARAADALVEVLDAPDLAVFHGEAYARLGDILRELALPYAALVAYVRGFEAATDQTIEEVSLRVPWAMKLADEVGDVAILQHPFSANLGLARTEDVRGRMAYLAAKENLRQQNYGVASGMLKLVKEGDPLYADAKMLDGILLNVQSRPEDALKAFEKAGLAARDKPERWKDVLQLNTARSWYGAGNYARAIDAYSRVSRASEMWPVAQFERAWAHFRIDDFNGTLATLITLDNPFFAQWYFPESDLLRIYSMFLVCKFPESNTQIDAFRVRYKPVHETLRAWRSKSAADNFEAVRRFVEKDDAGELGSMLMRPWAAEERFRDSLAAVQSADEQLDRMKAVAANPFTERARRWLKERRQALVEAEGQRIKDRFSAQSDEIGNMLGDAEIFTLDILRMKAQLYEMAAKTGEMPDAAKTVQRKERLKKGYREWPFEGEIWADELGYYRVNVIPQCPASMRQSVVGK